MDRITELREALAARTISAEELAELRSLLNERTAELEAGDLTDDSVSELLHLADDFEALAAFEAEVAAAEDERRSKAEEALARIRGTQAVAEDPEPVEGDEEGDEAAEPVSDEDKEPVMAAGKKPVPAAKVPAVVAAAVVSKVRSRTPGMPSKALVERPKMSLIASANVPGKYGINSGDDLGDPEKFAMAFAGAVEQSIGHRGPVARVSVAHSTIPYPDEMRLDNDERGNMGKIRARTSLASMKSYRDGLPTEERSLVASGGACAPSVVLYDLPVLGTAERPLRDSAMVRFAATRGGVRVIAPPKLSDLDLAINKWAAATDATPGGNTKGCLTVTCASPTETLVDSIVRCVKFGNFQARFYAESIDAWMELAATRWAREAEENTLALMASGSTAVSLGQGLGTTRDVLAGLDRACASIRSSQRLPRNFPFRFVMPDWLLDNMRADLARELPGASSERLAVAEAELMGFFTTRNVNVTTILDGESGQEFANQGIGALLNWPTTVVTYLYPEGSWLFLDGGTLDLGVVRDSTLNAKNDFQMFAESFESAVFHGVVSHRLLFDICPSGQTSAAVSFNPCTSGS